MLAAGMASSLSSCAQPPVYSSVTVVRAAPPGGVLIVHGGVTYRYVNGVYYRPYGPGFTMVTPPIGIHVSVLPAGFTTVLVSGRTYFVCGGVYYVEVSPNVYEVIEKPAAVVVPPGGTIAAPAPATVVSSLPAGTQKVTINGRRYYKVNDVYYEKEVTENGETFYRVAGKLN